VAMLFRILGSETRLRIIEHLALSDGCSFSELNEACEVSSGTLGYHLGMMKGLVIREGEQYRLSGEGLSVSRLIKQVRRFTGCEESSSS